MARPNVIFIGIKGTVVALDRLTGEAVWVTGLKGSDFVNLVIDGDHLYATNKGEVFCLDPATGGIRWHNPLKGMKRGLVTIATSSGSQAVPAAEQWRRDQGKA